MNRFYTAIKNIKDRYYENRLRKVKGESLELEKEKETISGTLNRGSNYSKEERFSSHMLNIKVHNRLRVLGALEQHFVEKLRSAQNDN